MGPRSTAVLCTRAVSWAEAGLRNARRGGLMAYGVNPVNLFRQSAPIIAKVLRGSKPSEVPAELPTKFELVVNPVPAFPCEMPRGAPGCRPAKSEGRCMGRRPLARATSLISASFAFRLISCIWDRMPALGEKLENSNHSAAGIGFLLLLHSPFMFGYAKPT